MSQTGRPTFRHFAEEILFEDSRFRLVRHHISHDRFDGGDSGRIERIVFERRPCVAMVIADPALEYVVLVEQLRAGLLFQVDNPWSIEIPAGIIDDGETPEEAAARECFEETGVEPDSLHHLLSYHPSSGASSERVELFLAIADLARVVARAGLASENEDIRTLVVPFEEALAMATDGRITSGHSILGLLLSRDQALIAKA